MQQKSHAANRSAPAVSAIPKGVPALTPYFTVSDGEKAIAFYQRAFGAQVRNLMHGPEGKGVAHCSLQIGEAVLNLSEPFGLSPTTGGKSSGVMLYVDDARAVFDKAVAAGAKALSPVADMFWGDRWGLLEDPFGNVWQIATHLEDITPAEMARRLAQLEAAASASGVPPAPPLDDTGSRQLLD